jgi:hypothetical protein
MNRVGVPFRRRWSDNCFSWFLGYPAKCTTEQKKQCPAWEFKSGNLCWFINGTICDGSVHKNWEEKMKLCRSCEVFTSIF